MRYAYTMLLLTYWWCKWAMIACIVSSVRYCSSSWRPYCWYFPCEEDSARLTPWLSTTDSGRPHHPPTHRPPIVLLAQRGLVDYMIAPSLFHVFSLCASALVDRTVPPLGVIVGAGCYQCTQPASVPSVFLWQGHCPT